MTRYIATILTVVSLVPATAAAQNPSLVQARDAFQNFDFPQALALAQRAINENLPEMELAIAYEVIGYSLGALDSTDKAVETLQQLIVIDPDREPDTEALPPRLVNLYTQAFAQVLVVRHVLVDSTVFVAGDGQVTMHYEVSRPARARIQVVGNGINTVVDSQLVDPGDRRFDWNAFVGGAPVPAGEYQVIVTVEDQRNQYQAVAGLTVAHAPVDTLPHIDRLQGFDLVPETRSPPRDWRPLGVSALLTGLASGTALALGDSDLSGSRREMIGVSLTAVGVGVVLSLRKPEPQPIPEAIQLNALIRQQIAAENRRITSQNEEIRRRVRLTVVQVVEP